MKAIITAIALMFVISANAGIASADDDRDSYEQHESRDHGENDRHERSNENSNRSGAHAADRNIGHSADRGNNHAGSNSESNSRFMPDWWPF
ncbi:MAG: hypothetical protein Q9M16_07680 [Mariprofundus sp.]|nr:hypothetical protein [Mariprofundus sp.]